jgi:glycosyltransferase involved in cell wall biosynthesis
MRSVVFVVPGRLETRTGGYLYDRRMTEGLRQHGWSIDVRELDESFPYPTQAALEEAAALLASLPKGSRVVVDGLAFGAMPAAIEREASRLQIVGLIHLPLGADVSLDPDTAARLEASERRALAAAALVIVTGAATLPILDNYGVGRDRIVVVEPGTDRAAVAQGSGGPLLRLLSVATLNPAKGHEILLQALAAVPHRDWHLTCAGSVTRHPATVERVRAAVRSLGLEERVSLVGELDASALAGCYDRSDLFVLATLQETYGMAVAEALAHGLPVVSTTTGAIPALVGGEAGLLVAPGNAAALAEALACVIGDASLRARLAAGARRVRDRLAGWEQAFEHMDAALARLDTHA